MAKQKEKKPLEKKNYIQSFTLVGEAKVSDYTFKIDERSNKSDWVYNQLNLQVDCGEQCGKVNAELMGGYGAERNNKVYVHGKDDNGNDDFKNSYTVDWDDRFDEDILEDIGELCFIRVGLLKDAKDKTVIKKFLTPYDAINYINENLEDGMVVNVKGNLRYSIYNDNVQCRKEITSIFLSNAKPEEYKASFLQTFLMDKDSTGKDKIDEDKNVMYVDAYLIEKLREYNGWDLTEGGNVKGGQFVPLRKTFEYDLSSRNRDQTNLIINQFFKVKKGIMQVTFKGRFVENGATKKMTIDDLSDEIKLLITMGMISEENAIATCTVNGQKERRMVLETPHIKLIGDDDKKVQELQRFEEVYSEDDFDLYFMSPKNQDEDEDEDETPPFTEEDTKTEEMDLATLLSQLQ